ncbi:hypothetical protein L195_g001259 [Trifolium pratense]|uniref:Uncharacterized protein n=1 Tax=Trifolium pratense TaxID=57577 RepID=A0A2K3NP73_TRIPR|nr:hypothetical protein L195_g001259 [Trifolium pratense]
MYGRMRWPTSTLIDDDSNNTVLGSTEIQQKERELKYQLSIFNSVAYQQGSAEDRVFAFCHNEDYATNTIVHEMRSNDDHDVPLVRTNRWEKPRIG